MIEMLKKSFTIQDLEALKVKCTEAYGKKHFTFNIKASDFEPTANVDTVRRLLNNYVSTCGGGIGALPYIEVFKDWACPVLTNLTPADVTVRVFGELTPDNNNIAFYNWTIDDWATTIKKVWGRVTANIKVRHSDFPAFMKDIKVYSIGESMGKPLWVISDIGSKFRVTTTRNVVGIQPIEEGKIAVLSFGYWSCDITVDGKPYVLTFTTENPGTGMKGEKDYPVIGIFDGENYYRKRA